MCEGQGDREAAGTDVKHGAVSNVSDGGIRLEVPHSRLPNMRVRQECNSSSRAGSDVEKDSYLWSFFRVPSCLRRYTAGLRTSSQGICLKCNFSVGFCS